MIIPRAGFLNEVPSATLSTHITILYREPKSEVPAQQLPKQLFYPIHLSIDTSANVGRQSVLLQTCTEWVYDTFWALKHCQKRDLNRLVSVLFKSIDLQTSENVTRCLTTPNAGCSCKPFTRETQIGGCGGFVLTSLSKVFLKGTDNLNGCHRLSPTKSIRLGVGFKK